MGLTLQCIQACFRLQLVTSHPSLTVGGLMLLVALG